MIDIKNIFLEVVEILNNLNISYFITGAISVSYYGEPRSTNDIDVVLGMEPKDVEKFVSAFSKNFFVNEKSISSAIQNKSFFQVIHKESLFKIDCWILKDDDFNHEMFERRRRVKIFDKDVYLPSLEDIIITKLEWFKKSDIDKHYLDAFGILKIQDKNIDKEYIEKWCVKKTVINIWEKMRKEKKNF